MRSARCLESAEVCAFCTYPWNDLEVELSNELLVLRSYQRKVIQTYSDSPYNQCPLFIALPSVRIRESFESVWPLQVPRLLSIEILLGIDRRAAVPALAIALLHNEDGCVSQFSKFDADWNSRQKALGKGMGNSGLTYPPPKGHAVTFIRTLFSNLLPAWYDRSPSTCRHLKQRGSWDKPMSLRVCREVDCRSDLIG